MAACGAWVRIESGFPPSGETVLLGWAPRPGNMVKMRCFAVGVWLHGTFVRDGNNDNGELPYPTHWARIADFTPKRNHE